LALGIDEPSPAVETELVDDSLMSSSMLSAHLAPLSSDLRADTPPCSFAGVMAPDDDLLGCVEAGFEAPRAACAYEKGTGAGADLTASACDANIIPKIGVRLAAMSAV
jgi:hypothetical protein